MTGGWEETSETKVKVQFGCYIPLFFMYEYHFPAPDVEVLPCYLGLCIPDTFKNPPVYKVQRHLELWLEEGNLAGMLRTQGVKISGAVAGKSPLDILACLVVSPEGCLDIWTTFG